MFKLKCIKINIYENFVKITNRNKLSLSKKIIINIYCLVRLKECKKKTKSAIVEGLDC